MKPGLSGVKKIYCIGIKGSGMAAIAEMLQGRGFAVSGSDTEEHFYTEAILDRQKIVYTEGFSEENIPEDVDLVVFSTAYNEQNNAEFRLARSRGLKMLSYPEALGALLEEKFGIAICGTHGKTTTSAILASILKAVGSDPSAIVGSQVLDWGGSALVGNGKYFVIEADEYQNKLQYYNPLAAVLTSADWDHPDFFPTPEDYQQVFRDFISRIPRHGFLIFWGDSTDTLEISKAAKCEALSYGFLEANDYRVINYSLELSGRPRQIFALEYAGQNLGQFEISLIGRHNVLNATAAIAVCHKLRIDLNAVAAGLKKFQGTTRRFEYIGTKNGALVFDDYAHHPEEIKATLQGVREVYEKRNIVVVFHPHTFTRTKALLQDFSQSFGDADRVIILDIYGSAREQQGGVSSEDLVGMINRYDAGKAEYVPGIQQAVDLLLGGIGPEDIVISMGAGNVWEVTRKIMR